MVKSFTFIETEVFTKRIVKLVDNETYAELQAELVKDPTKGKVIQGTGGLRKIRMAARGKGKRGGFRTVHYYAGDDVPVLLLALIDKGEDENLSKAERNELRIELAGYADDYRKGVIEKVAALNK